MKFSIISLRYVKSALCRCAINLIINTVFRFALCNCGSRLFQWPLFDNFLITPVRAQVRFIKFIHKQ